MLYGEDARAVLVNCLLEDVDLHDRSNSQRDAPKVSGMDGEAGRGTFGKRAVWCGV
jgi:hypothetical protein